MVHELLQGLSLVHEQGWVHHDVKLDNLLLMPDGSIKLTDFGFTKKFEAPSKMKAEQLRLEFVSPEIARDSRTVKAPTDMWSTGILICELCGVTVPEVKVAAQLKIEGNCKEFTGGLLKQLNEKAPEMVDLVSKMLTFKPGDRITADATLQDPALQDIMSKEELIQLINNLETK